MDREQGEPIWINMKEFLEHSLDDVCVLTSTMHVFYILYL